MRLYLTWLVPMATVALSVAAGRRPADRPLPEVRTVTVSEPTGLHARCYLEGSRDGVIWFREVELAPVPISGAAVMSMNQPLAGISVGRFGCSVMAAPK